MNLFNGKFIKSRQYGYANSWLTEIPLYKTVEEGMGRDIALFESRATRRYILANQKLKSIQLTQEENRNTLFTSTNCTHLAGRNAARRGPYATPADVVVRFRFAAVAQLCRTGLRVESFLFRRHRPHAHRSPDRGGLGRGARILREMCKYCQDIVGKEPSW